MHCLLLCWPLRSAGCSLECGDDFFSSLACGNASRVQPVWSVPTFVALNANWSSIERGDVFLGPAKWRVVVASSSLWLASYGPQIFVV